MKILIVKTSAIGDILHTFPVLAYLRQRFPEAQIDWAVEAAGRDLVAAHPDVGRVLCLDSKSWRKSLCSTSTRSEMKAFKKELQAAPYDLLFDLQGNAKSALVTYFAKARQKIGFGLRSVPEKPNLLVTTHKYEVPSGLNIRQRYLALVQAHFNDQTPFLEDEVSLKLTQEETARLNKLALPFPCLMVAFGSKWENKRLKEETLQEFLKLIDQDSRPFFLFIWGNEEEQRVADSLHALFPERSLSLGRLSLPLWQALMHKVQGVIAMDSAALHLCGTTGTPSFSIFGPSAALVYKPAHERHVALQGACPYGRTFEKRCPILRTCKTGSCMRDLAAQELFNNFKTWYVS